MQNIRVKRFNNGPSEYNVHVLTGGVVEPEDRSWLLFIHEDGSPPTLWLRTKVEMCPNHVEDTYVMATAVLNDEGQEVTPASLYRVGLRVLGTSLSAETRNWLEGETPDESLLELREAARKMASLNFGGTNTKVMLDT